MTTILQREVRDLTNLDALGELPRLLTSAASRTAQLLNYAELARTLSLPQTTLKRYLALLLGTFLVRTLPAWFRNVGKRLAKAPKLVVADTGLASHLLGIDAGQPRGNDTASGRLLESFAIMELEKQSGWSVRRPRLFHYRTHAQREVDIVLEDRAGEVVGIEVKASSQRPRPLIRRPARSRGCGRRSVRAWNCAVRGRYRRAVQRSTTCRPVQRALAVVSSSHGNISSNSATSK